MSLDWGPWLPISEGQTTPGARVTAVPWGTRGRFAVFVADRSGGIYTTGGDPLEGNPQRRWGPWASVSEGQTIPGGPVTAVPWGQRFALFVADRSGGIYTTGGDPQGGFGPWASVSEGQTIPGGPVTAVPWGQRFALFVADRSGGIYTTGGDPQGGFGPWASVSEGRTIPGGPVTALIPTIGGPITLFITDPNGGIYTAEGNPQRGFGPWSPVRQGIRIAPGSPVSASWALGSFHLNVTDVDGRIFGIVGSARNGWQAWTQVPGLTTLPGSPVTKLGSALFVTDRNGRVFTTAEAGPQRWVRISDGTSAPGSPITASATSYRIGSGTWHHDTTAMSAVVVFIAKRDGGVFCTRALNWQG
jgi:hypothetical protein